MRVSVVIASVCVACGFAHAEGASAPASAPDASTGVVVNLDALPIPLPRPKPKAEDLHPMAQARPRAKPTPETALAFTPMAPIGDVPLPRAKPGTELAAVAPDSVPVVAPHAAVPAPPPAMPVVIVSAPTTDTSIGVEISGVAQEIGGPSKPINPTEGFAVLSRVRFSNGQTRVPAQAQATLDTLAQRLASSHERVRLAAFSGKAGDYSSNARRLSLARALAIRTYLVSKGVAINRVDVLAFGGASDGIGDRVDVLVRGI